MTPVELVLSNLKRVKQVGNGWAACCPAHDDRTPSLSVTEGDDGRALMKCHAGCPVREIASSLGLTISDLMPPRPEFAPDSRTKSSNTFPTAASAVEKLERKMGYLTRAWTYHAANGDPVGKVLRWDGADGKKTIRPVSKQGDGSWAIAAMPDPRPLYRLPDLKPANRVLVCEGEKAADAAQGIGFVATTSAGGANAAAKTDWSPLAAKEVWVFPDNDSPGREYARQVVDLLRRLDPPATARIIESPGLPPSGDFADWIDNHGDAAEPDGMRAEVEGLAATVPRESVTLSATPSPVSRPRVVPDLICLADVEPAEVPWLWPGRIPLGRMSLLVGRPGAGKSFLTCDIAARLSRGREWPDGGVAPTGGTLFICAEDDPADTVVPRLNGAGADRQRVHMLRAAKLVESSGKESSVAFDLSNVDLIRSALDRLPDCRLVVIDPIGSYLGGGVDAHRDNEVRSVLAPLANLAAAKGVAVLLVCHTRKAEASFADDTALGSRAFVGLARSVLHLTIDPDNRTRKMLLPGKCNLAEAAPGLAFEIGGDPPALGWEPEPLVGVHADDAMAALKKPGDRRGPAPAARDAAKDWLTVALRDGQVPVNILRKHSEAAGLSWRTVQRASEELGVRPEKQSFSGGWAWSLPTAPNPQDFRSERPSASQAAKFGTLGESPVKRGSNSRAEAEERQVHDGTTNPQGASEGLSLFPESRGLPD